VEVVRKRSRNLHPPNMEDLLEMLYSRPDQDALRPPGLPSFVKLKPGDDGSLLPHVFFKGTCCTDPAKWFSYKNFQILEHLSRLPITKVRFGHGVYFLSVFRIDYMFND